jgi:hypothetical protein
MKTKPSFAKFLAATLLASAIFVTPMARAGLQIPYAVDTNTIHLWHFDGATNTTLTTDEVLTASITLTNAAQTNVPGALSTLGATAAFPQLNTAYRNVATNLTTGNCNQCRHQFRESHHRRLHLGSPHQLRRQPRRQSQHG